MPGYLYTFFGSMVFVRPARLIAGFHAEAPVPELVHVGEQWAPTDLFIGEHDHSVWELYLQAHGVSRCRAGRAEPLVLRPRHFFAVPPRTPHGMTGRPSARHHFFYVPLDAETICAGDDALLRPWREWRSVHVDQAGALEAPFRQLIREVGVVRPHQAASVQATLRVLLVEAARLLGDDGGDPMVRLHPGIERVKALLDQRYEEAWSSEQLGRAAGSRRTTSSSSSLGRSAYRRTATSWPVAWIGRRSCWSRPVCRSPRSRWSWGSRPASTWRGSSATRRSGLHTSSGPPSAWRRRARGWARTAPARLSRSRRGAPPAGARSPGSAR